MVTVKDCVSVSEIVEVGSVNEDGSAGALRHVGGMGQLEAVIAVLCHRIVNHGFRTPYPGADLSVHGPP